MINKKQEQFIRRVVDEAINNFAQNFSLKHLKQVENPEGVINSKRLNCFMSELGDEFIIYSSLSRSFDSAFGNMLESMGRSIAASSYKVLDKIDSIFLPEQDQHIKNIISSYDKRDETPKISHYAEFNSIIPKVTDSYRESHNIDNFFLDERNKIYYIIELKAGGDLDNKKAKSEKSELLKEYFMLKNQILISNNKDFKIKLFFATAYNKFGEGNAWRQERVLQYFAREELLIGKDYWNFICNDENDFDIVLNQYKKSAVKIQQAISNIKDAYHV